MAKLSSWEKFLQARNGQVVTVEQDTGDGIWTLQGAVVAWRDGAEVGGREILAAPKSIHAAGAVWRPA
jgi:hypothetical protein